MSVCSDDNDTKCSKLLRASLRGTSGINDLNEKMTSTVLKFADDTDISSNSQQELQRDLDTAVEWAQTWQIQLNTNKCKVMHVGHRNERAIYNMGNHRLEEVEEENDLGVLIHRTLSVSNNCVVAVKKAIRWQHTSTEL